MSARALLGLAFCLWAAAFRAPEPSLPEDVPSPSSGTWRLLALGHDTAAATLAWTAVVSRFADQESGGGSAEWLVPALEPIHSRDPRWSLPWMYGALMARHLDSPQTEQTILRTGIARFPDTHWFPYALGMALYLDHDDREGAARWLEHAASLPGAPAIHAEAARRLRQGPRP